MVPHVALSTDPNLKIDLTTALQYGQAQGYPPLYTFLRQFTRENIHPNVPYADGPDIVLTVGSTDGFSKCITAFANDWNASHDSIDEKEGLLCEEYAYMSAVGRAESIMNIAPVATDAMGMLTEGKGGLRDVLEHWDTTNGKRPHLMYTVTMGQNPTGSVLPLSRRREIYALCQQYDVLIIEDDPYWYLQYPSAVEANMAMGKMTPAEDVFSSTGSKSSGYDFLDSLVPSFLSIDIDGRVIRLDTFSKTIAPGCRLGWITAQPAFIERLLRITENSTQQPSGFVQSLVAQLLIGQQSSLPVQSGGNTAAYDLQTKSWDVSGWVRWLEGLRGNYERRMQMMSRILDNGKDLVKTGTIPALGKMSLCQEQDDESEDDWAVVQKTRIFDFAWPAGGMFLWLQVFYDSHPLALADKVTGPRLAQALWVLLTSVPYRVLLGPGAMFGADEKVRKESAWRFFRICFAAVDDGMIDPLSHRIVSGIQTFWRIKDVKVIDKLLEDFDLVQQSSEVSDLTSLAGFC